MALLTGISATQPQSTTAVVEQETIVVNLVPPQWQTMVVSCIATTPIVVAPPSVPFTVSITPAVGAINTQNGTLPMTGTVKDQFGNLRSGDVLAWASDDPRVTIDPATGIATGFQTGGNATITVTVVGYNVTGTAKVTTPAPSPTTLTMNAGFANLAAAANAAGQIIGFMVNDSNESHLNYAQNYQEMAGPGSLSLSEKMRYWVQSIASPTVMTTSFNVGMPPYTLAQEFARLQAQGTALKMYVTPGNPPAPHGSDMTTAVTSIATANTMLATYAAAITSFWNTPGSPAAYNGATAYSYGNTVTSGGFKWTCAIPSGTVTGITPALGAIATGGSVSIAANAGMYCWLKTSSGAIAVYNIANEVISFGSPTANPITTFIAPNTWVPTYARAIFAGDPGAKLEINASHFAYDGTGNGSTAQNTAHAALIAAVLAGGSVGGASNLIWGLEEHTQCSFMQNTAGTSPTGFNAAQLLALVNSITTLGYRWAFTEIDVADDMFEGSGAAGIPQRQAAIGVAIQNLLAVVKAATAKPHHLIFQNMRCPESWILSTGIFKRSDGLTQYNDIYLDFVGTKAPAYAQVQSFLTGGSGAVGSITVNDAALHFVPATLTDQWSFAMSLGALNWSSSNSAHIPVNVSGQFQCLAGSQTATITGTLATNPSVTGTISVTSGAPVLTTFAMTPPAATLSGGTLQVTATEVDQFNVAFGGGGGPGGVAVFTAAGFGLAANNASIAAATTQLYFRGRIKVDVFSALAAWTNIGLWGIDADGAGTHPKMFFGGARNGSGQFALTLVIYGTDTTHFGPATPFVALTAFTAGTYVTVYAGYDQTVGKGLIAVCDVNGNAINDGTNSLAVTQSIGSPPLMNVTGGANGRISINASSINPTGYPSRAVTWDGAAFSLSAPPAIVYSLTAACFAKPTGGDPGITMAWLMGDATSGAYVSATALVGTALPLTNCTGALGDAAGWTANAGVAETWASDVPAAATVNAATGLVTFVAAGLTNVVATLNSNSAIRGVCVVTCQTAPTLQSMTVSPTSMTLVGAGSAGQITPTMIDQYGNPYTGAVLTYNSATPAAASVSNAGLVTWVAPGSSIVTTTATVGLGGIAVPITVTTLPAVTGGTIEPAGSTPLISTGIMTAVPASGATFPGPGGVFSMFSPGTVTSTGEWSGNLVAVPAAQGTGLRTIYPPNVAKGGSPVRWGVGLGHAGGPFTTFYMRMRIRFSPNWTANGNPGVKIFEPRFDPGGNQNGGNQNDVIGANANRLGDGDFTHGFLESFQQNVTFRNIFGIAGAGDMAGLTRGTWHTIEVLWGAQSSVTSTTATSDGTCVMAMDGVTFCNVSDVQWVGPGDSPIIGWIVSDPSYGGTTASPPNINPNVYWDFDQWYVSGK